VQFPLPSGNIRTTKFLDIWKGSPQLAEVRSISLADLHGCSSCSNQPGGSRCPGLAYMEGNMRGLSTQDCEKSFARFGVMAGAGFDAAVIHQADGTLKDRFGRLAYVWTGSENLRAKPFRTKISIDGTSWYKGRASCILIGNVGNLFGGIEVFEHASPDDGRLEVGVVNADGVADWARTLARTAAGHPERSPFTRTTSARKIDVKLDRKVLYEIDGGARTRVKSFKVRVESRAVSICVPKDRSPE
jgi:diacylglycerol kinase family enzyme